MFSWLLISLAAVLYFLSKFSPQVKAFPVLMCLELYDPRIIAFLWLKNGINFQKWVYRGMVDIFCL